MKTMLAIGLTVGLLLCRAAPAVAENEAYTIVEKAVAAHGGDKVTKLQVMQTKAHGKLNIPNFGEGEFEFETYWQVPGQYKSVWRTQVKNQVINQTVWVNRKKGWKSAGGAAQEIPEQPNFRELKEQMYAESLDKISPLTGKSLALRPLGVSQDPRLPGQTLVGIMVSAEKHREVRMYFDKESGLLAKRENAVIDVTTGREIRQEIVYSSYKEFDGVKFWTKFTIYRDGQRFMETDITDVKFFDTLPDALFEP
jgi:hypothetical protein